MTSRFENTGLSVAAGSAAHMRFFSAAGQSNLGTGGSSPSEMPTSIPSSAELQYRMYNYYKDGLWRRAKESLVVSDIANIVFDVLQSTEAIGPLIFFMNEIMLDPRLNTELVGMCSNAVGGTFSIEWIPSALTPPGATLYSADFTQVRNARRRPNSTYTAKIVWQGESNAQTGLSFENVVSDGAWVKVAVTPTSNVGTAPDGTGTAQRITETVANSAHTFSHAFGVAIIGGGTAVPRVGTTVTYGMRFKTGTLAAPRNWVYIEGNGGTSRCWFNLNTGAVGTQTASTGAMVDLGNGWWFCTMTFVFASGGVTFGLATGDGVTSYAGSVTSDVLAWDATTNAMAVRWLPDWQDHRTQWRIDTGQPNLPFFFFNLAPTSPNPISGSFYENWSFLRTSIIPQILTGDPDTHLVQAADGPWTDGSRVHLSAGANPSEGEWASGISLAQAYLATLPP